MTHALRYTQEIRPLQPLVTPHVATVTLQWVEIDLPEFEARECVVDCVRASAWFEVTPLPYGLWRIRMKREGANIHRLDAWTRAEALS